MDCLLEVSAILPLTVPETQMVRSHCANKPAAKPGYLQQKQSINKNPGTAHSGRANNMLKNNAGIRCHFLSCIKNQIKLSLL